MWNFFWLHFFKNYRRSTTTSMTFRMKNLEVAELTAPEIDALFSRLAKRLFADSKSDTVTINILFIGDITLSKAKALKLVFECAAAVGASRVKQMLSTVNQNAPPPIVCTSSAPVVKAIDPPPNASLSIPVPGVTTAPTPPRSNPILSSNPPHPIYAPATALENSNFGPSPPKRRRVTLVPKILDTTTRASSPSVLPFNSGLHSVMNRPIHDPSASFSHPAPFVFPPIPPTAPHLARRQHICEPHTSSLDPIPFVLPSSAPNLLPDVHAATQLLLLQVADANKLIADHTARLLTPTGISDTVSVPIAEIPAIIPDTQPAQPVDLPMAEATSTMPDKPQAPPAMLCLPAPDTMDTPSSSPITLAECSSPSIPKKALCDPDAMFVCCANQTHTPISQPSDATLVDLRCHMCSKLTHFACLDYQSIVTPRPLPGDTTYTFTCRKCSTDGTESFAHGPKAWMVITRLALYNLWLSSNKEREYFQYKAEIINYVDTHWDVMCFPKPKTATWLCNVGSALSRFPDYFKSGAKQMGHAGWWSLSSYENFALQGYVAGRPRQDSKHSMYTYKRDGQKSRKFSSDDDSDLGSDEIMTIDDEIKQAQQPKSEHDTGVDTTPTSKRTPRTPTAPKRLPKLTIFQMMRVGLVHAGDVLLFGSHQTTVRPNGLIGEKTAGGLTNTPSKWVNRITGGKVKNGWGAKLRRGCTFYPMKSLRAQYFELQAKNDNKS
jgi:Restriction Enzyme Adenine Methylase Associated